MVYSIYAFILNGVVMDTIHTALNSSTIAGMKAKAVYGDDAYAVDCSQVYVMPGDTYADGKFYHDGREVPAIPNYENDMLQMSLRIQQQSNDIDDLIISLTPEV